MVEIWTDGACMPNPGTGGWAWVRRDGKSGSGREAPSTNQRMELSGVIDALEKHPGEPVRIISDSQYVIKGATEWFKNWTRNGWRNSEGKPVANRELWERLLAACKGRDVTFQWVKGHSGDEMNERADQIAQSATGLSAEEFVRLRDQMVRRKERHRARRQLAY